MRLQKRGLFGQALFYYRRAGALQSDSADAHSNIAVILGRKGDLAEAIVESRKLLRSRQKTLSVAYIKAY